MELTENARTVLARRYLARDSEGTVIESPTELFERVARAIAQPDASNYGASAAQVESRATQFYDAMVSLDFLPNSPTLMNAGRPLGQLAACFVVPVIDSTQAIFDAVGWAAVIQKTGGGTGFSFSRLRPAGDRVQSTGGIASGPVSFIEVFDVATNSIKQGGTRRGANMGILRVDHPDILEFISVKLAAGAIENFNLSVAITDEFMAALAAGTWYQLRNPRTGVVVGKLNAPRVFELMSVAAWAGGDPGVVFLDRMNSVNPTPLLGDFEATNPCGEQPLLPFESCTLGSINLGRFVTHRGGVAAFDRSRFEEVARLGVHFLDNVIDANRYPLPQIEAATRATRKIGIGVMGLADLLIELGIPYDDPRATEVADEVATALEESSLETSAELATSRGAFAGFDRSRWAQGLLGSGNRRPLRNATTTTVAPTGTISIIAGCSSGIEPIFAVGYTRRVLDGAQLTEFHPAFRKRAEAAGIMDEALGEQIAMSGSVRAVASVPEELAALFGCAHDIDYKVHIEMQAIFQHRVHAAVSKTINLPNDASAETVRAAYQLAYDRGCKGVTVYRDGSRAAQVLSFGEARRPHSTAAPCPDCEGPMIAASGCSVCPACGYSVCG